MLSKLYNLWQILKSNLWFFPAFVSLLYCTFTLGFYGIESAYLQNLDIPGILFSGGAEDAKSLTINLLSSMITMATLAISLTMVVLSLAASQLGPRLIRTFMSDKQTKMFIGMFFGAVIACFTLAMILYDADSSAYTPKFTITAVFAVCFANMFVLLAFVHHVAKSSIADEVIIQVAHGLNASLDRLTLNEDEEIEHPEPDHSDWPKDFDNKRHRIYFNRSGYVQHINYHHLLEIAQEHGLYIQIHFKAGHFLVEGEDGVRVYPKHKVDEHIENAIRDSFIVGSTRTPTQDIEYSIRHLVEIGLRAQSPGQDDNFTALTVMDHLSAALAILFQKHTPSEWMEDEEGRVRIWAKQSGEDDIIFSALDQMRQSARDKPDIVMHMLKKLKVLATLARTKRQNEGIQRQINQIEFDLKFLDTLVLSTDDLQEVCNEINAILKEKRHAYG